MSLNGSIVPQSRDATLEGFLLQQGSGGLVGGQCRVAPTLTRHPPAGAEKHEAIRWLNPAISESRTLATLRDPAPAGMAKLLCAELSVDAASATMEASV